MKKARKKHNLCIIRHHLGYTVEDCHDKSQFDISAQLVENFLRKGRYSEKTKK